MNLRDRHYLPFGALVLAGIGLRLWLAWARFDRVWADEHFQTIEPAAKLFHGKALLAWEWLQGYRSWLLPAFHLPFFWLGSLFGVTNGSGLVGIVRSGYALADAAVWLNLFGYLARTGLLSPLASQVGLALALLSPAVLLWSVTSLQDHLAMLLFWGFLPAILDWTESRRPAAWIAAGFVLVVPAWVKIQLAPACGAVGIALAIARYSIEKRDPSNPPFAFKFAGVLSGVLIAAAFYGLVDQVTLGTFAGSAIRQLRDGARISLQFGTSPWWSYFPRTLEVLGPELSMALAAIGIGSLAALRTSGRSDRNLAGSARIFFPLVAFTLFVHFGVHSAVPHKETRFLLPMLPAMLLLPLAAIPFHFRVPIPRFLRGNAPALLAVLALAAAGGGMAYRRPLAYSSVEVGRLEDAIRLRRPAGGREIIVCLIGHNWSWTRGFVGAGGPVRYIELGGPTASRATSGHEDTEDLAACEFAIVREDLVGALEALQPEMRLRWREIASPQGNFTAWARAQEPGER